MRNTKLIKMAAIAAAVSVASTLVVANTVAKYTSVVSGTDTAQVASFEYTVTDLQATSFTADVPTISVFDTIVTDDSIVTSDTNVQYIAPGTKSEFGIIFNNQAEVPIQFTVDTLGYANEADIPLIYEYQGGYYSDFYELITRQTLLADTIAERLTELETEIVDVEAQIADIDAQLDELGLFDIIEKVTLNTQLGVLQTEYDILANADLDDVDDIDEIISILAVVYGAETAEDLREGLDALEGTEFTFLLGVNDTETVTLTGNMDDLLALINENNTTAAAVTNPNDTVTLDTITCYWAFETYADGEILDEIDTVLGETGNVLEVTMTPEVTAVQLDQ